MRKFSHLKFSSELKYVNESGAKVKSSFFADDLGNQKRRYSVGKNWYELSTKENGESIVRGVYDGNKFGFRYVKSSKSDATFVRPLGGAAPLIGSVECLDNLRYSPAFEEISRVEDKFRYGEKIKLIVSEGYDVTYRSGICGVDEKGEAVSFVCKKLYFRDMNGGYFEDRTIYNPVTIYEVSKLGHNLMTKTHMIAAKKVSFNVRIGIKKKTLSPEELESEEKLGSKLFLTTKEIDERTSEFRTIILSGRKMTSQRLKRLGEVESEGIEENCL